MINYFISLLIWPSYLLFQKFKVLNRTGFFVLTSNSAFILILYLFSFEQLVSQGEVFPVIL